MRPLAWLLAAAVLGGCVAADPPANEVPRTIAWSALASAPTPRTEVTVAALDGRVFAIGGFTDALPEEASIVAGASRIVEVYDAAEDAWSAGPEFPVPLHHSAAAAVGGSLFVLGGYSVGVAPSTLAWRLDGAAWSPIAPLPEARAAHAAAVIDDIIYLVGGVGPEMELASGVLAYDPAADAWSRVAELPTPRDHLAAVALDGKLYVASGQRLSHADTLPALEAWDPAAGEWESLPPLPTPRNSVAAAAFGGRVVVLGGQDAERTFADVEAFDPATGAWEAWPAMPTARHGFGAAAVGDALLALLGGPEPGLSVTGAVEALAEI